MADKDLQLPISIVSRVDVGRLLREIEGLEEFLKQASIREPGTAVKMPRTSRLFEDLISSNQLNPLLDGDRQRLHTFLISVKAKAPVLHMSFSADPSPLFTQKLIAWIRENIHPFALMQPGLQPNIGAGCMVRTTNKYFDFSLRQHFLKRRDVLVGRIHGVTQDAPQPVQQPPQPEVTQV